MSGPNPQLRFLLRGSTLLFVLLGVWWWILQPPLLAALRVAESVALRLATGAGPEPIAVDGSGNWDFRIPVDDTPQTAPGRPGAVKFNSIGFTLPRADAVLFTFSLPLFWAIVLAGPAGKSAVRALLLGSAVVALVEVLALLVEVDMMAYAALDQLHAAGGGAWFREFEDRLLVGVVPFLAPIVAAVALHRELRMQVFGPPAVGSAVLSAIEFVR